MERIAAVAIGGALGATARYLLSGVAHRLLGLGFPYGTLLVNGLGCLAIGVLVPVFARAGVPATASGRLLVVTGLLGALTTFSTFGYETVALSGAGHPVRAALNVAANVLIGLAAVVAGRALAHALLPAP